LASDAQHAQVVVGGLRQAGHTTGALTPLSAGTDLSAQSHSH
jgi:hypothetical protein